MAKIYISTKSNYNEEENNGSKPDFEGIEYNPETMKKVKKMVNKYITTVRESAESHSSPEFYIYSLLAMNILSQEYLKCYSTQYLKTVMTPKKKENDEE